MDKKNRIKIAIYTIALNEEQFVKRWYESAKDADYLLIADTGSTDKTVEIAESLGINVVHIKVSPWRFDDARNAALAALPLDIDMCLSLDMDEIVTPGFREPIENAWKTGITRPTYKHIWSWKEDGSPGLEFAYDHIHARKGYRWRHPVHECLYPYSIPEVKQFITGIETHHHPDPTKSRAQYLPLLELSVQEDPHNDRNAFYYGRELYFYRRYQEAAVQLKRYLGLPTATWNTERAGAMRFLAKCEPENAEFWLKQSLKEVYRREGLVELSQHYYENRRWQECFDKAIEALAITERPLDYLSDVDAWGFKPYDLAAISAYHLGKLDLAEKYGKQALSLDPENERLKNNLKYYKET